MALPVTDVPAATDWFAAVLGFDPWVTFEEEDRVTGALVEHPSGAALFLRADPVHALALAGFPAVTFAVADQNELQRWDEYLTTLGVTHTEVTPAHLGWEIRLWGPGMIEMRLTTSEPLDGVTDDTGSGDTGRSDDVTAC